MSGSTRRWEGGGGLTGTGDSGGAGGGGSNIANTAVTINIVNYSGSGATPGNAGDPAWLASGCSLVGNYGAGVGATTACNRGGNGEVSITALVTTPVINSALSEALNQGQAVSYQITALGNPTSYGASGLPTGLSINTSTGQITGNVTASGTISSTISATNGLGTTNATLVWTITAAVIVDSGSVSPSTIVLSQSLVLTRNATANFGIAFTENVIWPPAGQAPITLGNMMLGSMSYTPVSGAGVYTYEMRVVDNYSNFVDQDITFTVNSATVNPPTSVNDIAGSTFVTLSWSGAYAQLGILNYRIYRNGVYIANTGATTYQDTTVSLTTSYIYTIATVDTQGNISATSSSLPVTTPGDFEVFTPIP